jgi:hypothetical protein
MIFLDWNNFSENYNHMYHMTEKSNLISIEKDGDYIFQSAKTIQNLSLEYYSPRNCNTKGKVIDNKILNYQKQINNNCFSDSNWKTSLKSLNINYPYEEYDKLYNNEINNKIAFNKKAYYYLLDHFIFFFSDTTKGKNKRKIMEKAFLPSKNKSEKILFKIKTDFFSQKSPTYFTEQNSGSNCDRRNLSSLKPDIFQCHFKESNKFENIVEILYTDTLVIPKTYVEIEELQINS